MTKFRLAVIGAGPKGAAITTKAQLINEHHREHHIEVVVYEKGDYASNWNGGGSYTDGEQELCTPATRDLGFPYDATFGLNVQQEMQERYSWMAYLVGENKYSAWINQRRERPTHADFAKYLALAIKESGADCRTFTTVVNLRAERGRWIVTSQDREGKISEDRGFDGVVITGPGPAQKVTPGFSHEGLFDGEDVWTKLDDLKSRLDTIDEEIVIIGGGGTAAAIAAWMIRKGVHKPISFISEQPTFYTRHGDYFENRVFDDEDMWLLLNENQRRDFVGRTTRAVVWAAVSDQLAAANNLRLLPGRVISLAAAGEEFPELVEVKYRPSNNQETLAPLNCGVVVDASGFDKWWFKKLLPTKWQEKKSSYFEKQAAKMSKELVLPLSNLPPLHVPMVSWTQGPGFSSLMVLGRMADRILSKYVQPF
ncbi:SidA/IucD/PvdA family monooxygenase [Rhizobium leguminosarum]|uniref:SidA/IucD/PvdA family monooxygenase n=1 Tax=Rhizobium leguminosarum TaxID=384 RepID=UPI001C91FB9D|nr:SidA/IucD/PvdA family monooxygenase [Rhizobium leguminosarum]MBY3179092.1 SidA/IucD/PvdA family monooxygenase [Rhizobium leguminosarum]